MWAMWREEGHVYVQEHSVLPGDLDAPFDPNDPYGHVGERVPAAANALPIPEWRVELEHVHAAMLGIRWPRHSLIDESPQALEKPERSLDGASR